MEFHLKALGILFTTVSQTHFRPGLAYDSYHLIGHIMLIQIKYLYSWCNRRSLMPCQAVFGFSWKRIQQQLGIGPKWYLPQYSLKNNLEQLKQVWIWPDHDLWWPLMIFFIPLTCPVYFHPSLSLIEARWNLTWPWPWMSLTNHVLNVIHFILLSHAGLFEPDPSKMKFDLTLTLDDLDQSCS